MLQAKWPSRTYIPIPALLSDDQDRSKRKTKPTVRHNNESLEYETVSYLSQFWFLSTECYLSIKVFWHKAFIGYIILQYFIYQNNQAYYLVSYLHQIMTIGEELNSIIMWSTICILTNWKNAYMMKYAFLSETHAQNS